MRSQLRILVGTLIVGAVAAWGPVISTTIAEMETFRIRDVRVTGLTYLTEARVVAQLDLGQFASVWGDREHWEDRLSAHPLISHASIERRLPGGLRVEVVERTPVALAPTPTLEPVDSEGHRLPLDPTHFRLDLPVISASAYPPPDASVFPGEVRALASELERLTEVDPTFVERVSTIGFSEDGALLFRLIEPRVDVLAHPGTPVGRLRQAEAALAHALAIRPGEAPVVVDLRYSGQVVVRHNR